MITRLDGGNSVRIDNSTNLKTLSSDMKANGMWNKVKYSLKQTTVYSNIEIPNGSVITLQPYELLVLSMGIAPATSSGMLNKESTLSWVSGTSDKIGIEEEK